MIYVAGENAWETLHCYSRWLAKLSAGTLATSTCVPLHYHGGTTTPCKGEPRGVY